MTRKIKKQEWEVPDFDATSGAKYYYDNNTGEMSWEPPPGSVGGSAESGV